MPDADTRSIITVQERQAHTLAATFADLSVTVEGLSLFSGAEALKKAREVAQLVSDLTASGLPQDAVFLEGITADVHSGTLAKNSRARYRLRIHCAELAKLADVVGIVAGQKNTTLHGIDWGYPDDAALHDTWLLACIARVTEKSTKIAAALGVRVIGVASFTEFLEDPEAGPKFLGLSSARSEAAGMRRQMTSEDLGLEISHAKTLFVAVAVNFLVSGRD